jgi:hypothetical protein
MIKMTVRHKVADFKTWKPVFDQHDAVRKQFGCKGGDVFANVQNPNDVLVVLQWDSKEQAIKFGQSPGLKEAEERGGVLSVPEVSFAE